jgi:hypothetical protein
VTDWSYEFRKFVAALFDFAKLIQYRGQAALRVGRLFG